MVVSKDSLKAAYQGYGWLSRQGTLAEDVIKGYHWNRCSVTSEWQTLKEVLLFIPNPETPSVEDVNFLQHLEPVNYSVLAIQLEKLAKCYEQLGIKVHLVQPISFFDAEPVEYHYNLAYVRDLFLMTPEGAIVSRMASMVRAGEEKHAARTLAELAVPIIKTISGDGTFEGADALWLCPDLVLVGVGNRTNESGFQQVKQCLESQGIRCIKINLPPQIQHLLGILQIVDRDLAVVRGELLASENKHSLRQLGFSLIELDETVSVRERQAMNFVTISSRRIIMVAGNPEERYLYESNGIEVAAELDVSELLKGAGGIGCATGILSRKPDCLNSLTSEN